MTTFEEIEVEEAPDASESPRRAPRPSAAKPSDLLDIRRTMSRLLFGKQPSAQQLREHAEKFGIDGVAETGAEAGMSEESLTALITSLDRINTTMRRDPRRKHLSRAPAKTSASRRARELLHRRRARGEGLTEPVHLCCFCCLRCATSPWIGGHQCS